MSVYSQVIAEACPPPRSAARAAAPVSAVAAMVLPSVGSVIFAVALAQVLFLSGGTQVLFRDSDAGWHLRVGEAILSSGSVPRADTFSYTHWGRAWFAWEWLADALLGGVHRAAGLPGVALLAALAIAAAAWGAARLALSLGGNLFFTAAATVLLMGATSIHWLARPHIFSWLLALVFVAVAERERRQPSPLLYLLPLLACVWANAHGSFLLGPGILLLYALGQFFTPQSASPIPHSGRRLAAAGLAALLATFVNPYGWQMHAHIVAYLRNTYLMDHISEFRSFNFHAPGALYVELFLLVTVAGGFAMLRQRAWGPALLTFALLHLALYSARHLPTAAIVLLPLSVAALTREAERLPRLARFLNYSERIGAIDRKIYGVVPAVIVLAATVAAVTALARAGQVGFDPARFPLAAAAYLEQRGLQHHVFARDQWGGYLIYRFNGRLKVFIDGRSDFYGQDLLERYGQVVEVKPGWDSVLAQEQVHFVLVAPEQALASALRMSRDWKPVYADRVAVIFERIT